MYGPHSKYRQLLIEEMEKQSTRFICIVYPEKHNGTVLLTYEAHTKQLVSPHPIWTNNYSNPQRPQG